MLVYLQMIGGERERQDFEAFYRAYRNLAFHVAREMLPRDEDAEDAVAQAMTQRAEEGGEHRFSSAFERRMARLGRRVRGRKRLRQVGQWAAMVALIAAVTLGGVLAFSPQARADMANWIRQVEENAVWYVFFGPEQTETLSVYRPQWLPEGFELVEEQEDEWHYISTYENRSTGEVILFDYFFTEEGFQLEVSALEGELHCERVNINGVYTEYFWDDEEDGNAALMWFDEAKGIEFTINSDAGKMDILHMAESVKLVNATK